MGKKKGIIFDLDGTLWDSSHQLVPAWNAALKRHPELHCQMTLSVMHSLLGKTFPDIARILLPALSEQEALQIIQECCEEEQIFLRKNGGILFPDLEETLKELNRNFDLFIVSNCQDGYIETFLEIHHVNSYFKDIECIGRTGQPKGQNIITIMKRNNLQKAVYVGDTQIDCDAAQAAQIPFIHAAYGFGSVSSAADRINSISELPMAAMKLL